MFLSPSLFPFAPSQLLLILFLLLFSDTTILVQSNCNSFLTGSLASFGLPQMQNADLITSLPCLNTLSLSDYP